MALEAGRNLLHYRLVEQIGEGGMGVVWKAVDTDLGRDVAIKVLPDAFSRDAERLARFQREAKLLATLNHANIATVHGLHEVDGVRFLAMELIAGEDLSRQLAAGPLPVERAVEIGRQVAEALEAAHESGIVHRDLKPANVIVRPDGQVKVLDFGLAKSAAGSTDPDISMSPTMTSAGTQAGMILGTAAYLSPEQAKGQPVDRRTDIWAFGVVLHEMLSGQRTFRGEGLSETLAAVILKEPDLDALPAETPPRVRELIRRCLVKDPRKRLRDIGEARLALEEPDAKVPGGSADVAALDGAGAPAPRRRAWPALVALPLVAVVAFLVGRALVPAAPPAPPGQPTRLTVEFAAGQRFASSPGPVVALSPDGGRVVMVMGEPPQLHVRNLQHFEDTVLAGTEGAMQPFFSPDGEWIGFFAGSKLKKVSVHGGAPLTLANVAAARGGTWASDDAIVYAPNTTSELFRIPAAGGEAEPVTTMRKEQGAEARSHRWPHALPGGRFVLFTNQEPGTRYSDAKIALLDLQTLQTRDVHRGGSSPLYVPEGFLLFSRDGTVFAARFDPNAGSIDRSPVPVLENVAYAAGNGGAGVALSRTGTLLYFTGSGSSRWLGKVGRLMPDGSFTEWPLDPAKHRDAALSPDGRQLAYTAVDQDESTANIWVYDIERQVGTRLTFAEAWEWHPSWSADGQYILFSSNRSGAMRVYRKRADGTGDAELVAPTDDAWNGASASPDGRFVAFSASLDSMDLFVLDLEAGDEPTVFLSTSARELFPKFSPDGKWIVYISDESGRSEAYVRPYPGPGGKWQISRDGCERAEWSPDGRKLYLEDEDGNGNIRVAEVQAEGASLRVGRPVLLAEPPFEVLGYWSVGADGALSMTIQETEQEVTADRALANMVFNWPTELDRLVPR